MATTLPQIRRLPDDDSAPPRKRARRDNGSMSVSTSPDQLFPKRSRSGATNTNGSFEWGKLPGTVDENEGGDSKEDQSAPNGERKRFDTKKEDDLDKSGTYLQRLSEWSTNVTSMMHEINQDTHQPFSNAKQLSQTRWETKVQEVERQNKLFVEQLDTDCRIQEACSARKRDEANSRYKKSLETHILDRMDMLIVQGHIRAQLQHGGEAWHEKRNMEKRREMLAAQAAAEIEVQPRFNNPLLHDAIKKIQPHANEIANDLRELLGNDDSSDGEYSWNSRRPQSSNLYSAVGESNRKAAPPRYRPTRATTEARRLAHSIKKNVDIGFDFDRALFWIGEKTNWFCVGTRVCVYSHICGKACGYISGFNDQQVFVNVKMKRTLFQGSRFEVAKFLFSDIMSGEYAFHRLHPVSNHSADSHVKQVKVKTESKDVPK